MDDIKSIFASKTVWGALIALLSFLLGTFNHTITPTDQQALVDIVSKIGETVGPLLAIYGRVKATTKIG